VLSELFALLAKDPNTTNAVATVASAIAATFAVVVSSIAVYVSLVTLKHQRRHNVLSVRPIPIVTVADYEDSIRVKVRNHGSGPMIVKRVQASNGTQMKEGLLEWMPALPTGVLWTTFVGPVSDQSLLPGSELVLLELSGDCEDRVYRAARAAIRDALAPLSVVVDYTDIYDSDFKPYTKALTWFGRQ
jgi:hypothetical protein